jgi:hypothetical protein
VPPSGSKMPSGASRSVRAPHPTTSDPQVAISTALIARRRFFIGELQTTQSACRSAISLSWAFCC